MADTKYTVEKVEELLALTKLRLNNSIGFQWTGGFERQFFDEFLKKSYYDIFHEGRYTVLKDFDDLCLADGFVGFTDDEWRAVRKFFSFNKHISGLDKK
jgi:hypothetical protein